MPDLNDEALRYLVDLAHQASDVREIGNSAIAIVPDGCQVADLTKYIYNDRNAHPIRVQAHPVVTDALTFIAYFNTWRTSDSQVFASETEAKMVAILDYHGPAIESPSVPNWCQHRLTMQMRVSEQWKVWIGQNNKQLSQDQFGEFLEQNVFDISTPEPATIKEIVSDLQGKTTVEFGGGVERKSGQVFLQYSETTTAMTNKGKLAMPDHFEILIPPFIGGPAMPMQALLRFRVNGGRLSIFYTLIRPEEVLRKAFLDARNEIATQLAITVLNGSPGPLV